MILLTGASGFVGNRLVESLNDQPLILAGRQQRNNNLLFFHLDLEEPSLITDFPSEVDVVVHTAARVHIMNDTAIDSEAAFNRVNAESTLALAKLAASRGVKRFVFISSIKVNGEHQIKGRPYTSHQAPSPQDAYGRSKERAEAGLRSIALETGMEVVVIRPPLVYGPGVKANFEKLVNLIQKGFPLPLGGINNLRSLVGLDNLVDLIKTCCFHESASNETFLVSDNDDVSTPELIRRISQSLNKPARLIPISESFLRMAGKLTGRVGQVERLCSSLQVDISHTMSVLNWKPPYSMQDQLSKTVEELKLRTS